MRLFGGVLAALLMAATAFAQTAQLSTEEKLELRVHQLEIQLETALAQANACQGALGAWRALARSAQLSEEQRALRAEIETAHPGFDLDVIKGELRPQQH